MNIIFEIQLCKLMENIISYLIHQNVIILRLIHYQVLFWFQNTNPLNKCHHHFTQLNATQKLYFE